MYCGRSHNTEGSAPHLSRRFETAKSKSEQPSGRLAHKSLKSSGLPKCSRFLQSGQGGRRQRRVCVALNCQLMRLVMPKEEKLRRTRRNGNWMGRWLVGATFIAAFAASVLLLSGCGDTPVSPTGEYCVSRHSPLQLIVGDSHVA